MIKKTKSISINVLSVFIILTCLLLGLITPTNAWFTDEHNYGIYINVTVSNLNFKLYQVEIDSGDKEIEGSGREIFTDIKNTEDPSKAQYISLNGIINPEEEIVAALRLKNEDKGATSVYIRFRLQLMARGLAEDTEIPINLIGYTAPTASTPGFVKEGDYYYYKENSLEGAANAKFEQNAEAYIMKKFSVPYSSFFDESGNTIIKNSDSVYIKLVVEESAFKNFQTGG